MPQFCTFLGLCFPGDHQGKDVGKEVSRMEKTAKRGEGGRAAVKTE